MQDSPPHWVAVHRRHHEFADEEADPHSPLAGFFWAHMGWLMVKLDDMSRRPLIERYAKDIIRDPYYSWLERRSNWIKVALLSWLAFFAAGFAWVALTGGSSAEAAQFGFSLMIWGAVLRTVVVWHITWSVNSVTHVWGYRNYNTPRRQPQQCADRVPRPRAKAGTTTTTPIPRSARHGHMWWEIDLTWLAIRLLMALGLAKNVALPSPILSAKFNGPSRGQIRSRSRPEQPTDWRSAGSDPAFDPGAQGRLTRPAIPVTLPPFHLSPHEETSCVKNQP